MISCSHCSFQVCSAGYLAELCLPRRRPNTDNGGYCGFARWPGVTTHANGGGGASGDSDRGDNGGGTAISEKYNEMARYDKRKSGVSGVRKDVVEYATSRLEHGYDLTTLLRRVRKIIVRRVTAAAARVQINPESVVPVKERLLS